MTISQKRKNRKSLISEIYGKRGSWILHMFYLIHSAKWQHKKNFKKTTCRHTFGLGRKMGRNGCRLWKRPKLEKIFCSSSALLCDHLISKVQFLIRPTIRHPGCVTCYGPKSVYFALLWNNPPQGSVLGPRPLLLGSGTSPGWVLLIIVPLSYLTKKMGSLISGSLASSTLKGF